MDRRLAGVLLVVAACATAAIFPLLGGVKLTGTAQPVPLPANPLVGDCVYIAPNAPVTVGSDPRPDQEFNSALDLIGRKTAYVIKPCDGRPVAGEVVAISTIRQQEHAQRSADQPVELDCRSAVFQYAGMTPVDDRFVLADGNDEPVSWSISMNVVDQWLVPSPQLRSAGRNWAACIVSAAQSDSYSGTVAAAYLGGRLPNEIGVCWDLAKVDVTGNPVDCNVPHFAEVISIGTLDDPAAARQADIQQSCEKLAQTVIRRSDPTDSGVLSVVVSPNADEIAVRPTIPISIVCYVASGGRSLTGSLVGLGKDPFPYAK